MEIFTPLDSRTAPSEAAAMTLPKEETTPPVTKTKRVMGSAPPECGTAGTARLRNRSRRADRLANRPLARYRLRAVDQQPPAGTTDIAVGQPQQRMRVDAGGHHRLDLLQVAGIGRAAATVLDPGAQHRRAACGPETSQDGDLEAGTVGRRLQVATGGMVEHGGGNGAVA